MARIDDDIRWVNLLASGDRLDRLQASLWKAGLPMDEAKEKADEWRSICDELKRP